MEKGIPLPEFPFESDQQSQELEPQIIPILGMVLSTLSLGAMVVLYLNLPAATHEMWISPLPFTFLGAGFIAFHFLDGESRR